ncbi:F-box only protein 31 [Grus japonensis]|uniref:F-box only protein 31 n=1 Tax=Grus japonensis TaxID=30415 RepID=A0ABC9XBZ6_GRUJA
MPAGSEMDPLLAKAKPISNSGRASGITFKKGRGWGGKPTRGIFAARERKNSADTQVSEEGGGGGAPGARADIPLQPMEKTMVRQAVYLQPMEVKWWSRYPPVACGEPHTAAVCEELQPMGRTHTEEIHGGLSPVGGTPCWSRGRV